MADTSPYSDAFVDADEELDEGLDELLIPFMDADEKESRGGPVQEAMAEALPGSDLSEGAEQDEAEAQPMQRTRLPESAARHLTRSRTLRLARSGLIGCGCLLSTFLMGLAWFDYKGGSILSPNRRRREWIDAVTVRIGKGGSSMS